MQLQSQLNILCNVSQLYLDWQQIQTQSLVSQWRYQPPVESETSPRRGVRSTEVSAVLLLISHQADKEQDLATGQPRCEKVCWAHVLYGRAWTHTHRKQRVDVTNKCFSNNPLTLYWCFLQSGTAATLKSIKLYLTQTNLDVFSETSHIFPITADPRSQVLPYIDVDMYHSCPVALSRSELIVNWQIPELLLVKGHCAERRWVMLVRVSLIFKLDYAE